MQARIEKYRIKCTFDHLLVVYIFLQRVRMTNVHATMACVARLTSSVMVAMTVRIGVTKSTAVSGTFPSYTKNNNLKNSEGRQKFKAPTERTS